MILRSFHSRLIISKNLPSNGIFYTQLQIMARLYSQQHQGNDAVTERIGSHFNKAITLLTGFVHPCKIELRTVRVSTVVDILTLQTYERWRFRKAGQIMLIEYVFDLDVEESWITMLILQLVADVAPELIVLREHRYHRNLKNPPRQSQFMKM
jgi:hypothetical protein